jgi:hypothetical protein
MENIALAFSGGGFRAACFSLGALSYFNKVQHRGKPLLLQVKFISSTSGGSITNLVYSSYIFQGKTFEECLAFMKNEMDGEKLLNRALKILNRSDEWKKRPDKTRNLINAFSIAYDEMFARKEFGLFNNRQNNPHVEEICVNATEFTNGLPFRFQSQNENLPRGRIGNRFIFFRQDGLAIAEKIKLSDVLASSSCFPSGFEPLIYPSDYTHSNLSKDDLKDALSFKANEFTISDDKDTARENSFDLLHDKEFTENFHFGIMDGGVADNQAIDAFELADDRRENNKLPVFDLFMACDVTSNYMDGYTLPLEKKTWNNKVRLVVFLFVWLLAILVLPYLLVFGQRPWQGWMYIISTISALLALPVVYFLYRAIKSLFIKKPGSTWGVTFRKNIWTFLSLRIGALKQMISSRLKSVFILANDIYLKQIRRMYYEGIFGSDKYKDRSIQNTIYDLSKAKKDTFAKLPELLRPTDTIMEMAEKSRTMGTTLWFDANHQKASMKESIIATGHFTTCFSLLKYLAEKPVLSPEETILKQNLESDWQKFRAAKSEAELLKACGC